MATRKYDLQYIGHDAVLVIWPAAGETAFAADDDGAWFDCVDFPDKTVQVHSDTWGTATVGIEGTNDVSGTRVSGVLDDSRGEGNSMSFTADDIRTPLQNTVGIRPKISAGTGSGWVVKMLCHR